MPEPTGGTAFRPEAPRCDVAILTYDLRASGVVRNALRIGRALVEAGLSVEFWVVRRRGALVDEIDENIRLTTLRCGAAPTPRDLDSLMAVPAIAEAIDEIRPAVLFSPGNQMHLHAGLALRRAKGANRPRFVGRASNAVIDTGRRTTPMRAVAGLIERFQFRGMDRVIAVSKELRRDLIRGTGLAASKVEFIPNGVDERRVRRDAVASELGSSPSTGPFILGVGRLSRQKDFATLIRAFARVRRERSKMRLVVIGQGSAVAELRLRVLIRFLGLRGAVSLVGFSPDVVAHMARASLFVSSSRWEGSSNVILEALAAGCPIVATAAPTGVREVLARDGLAVLSPVGDHAALAEAILRRLGEPRNEAALRRRAAEYPLAATLVATVVRLKAEVAAARVRTERGEAPALKLATSGRRQRFDLSP